ncbi:MAG TPA: cytochrome ubiquinol oxidase subunit I [Hyphomonadaceae bacterium]
MVEPDVLALARAQFGLNIGFHILFPSLTIGLAWLLLYFRLRYAATGDARWHDSYRLWVKIFALSFAMGVVSGITMSFQFGTNWPGYMLSVGNIAGPLLTFEVLFAFFLEATFLGVMLFGMNRVSAGFHIFATAMVAIGTSLSAFWILALNSWMHTPAGFTHDGGQLIAADWLDVIFNPSFPFRLAHMLAASGLTTAFAVAGLSAWRLLRAPHDKAALQAARTGVVIAAVLAPLQVVLGDLHGLNTLEHQPAKIAAMEGLWETRSEAPLVLFAIPDEQARANRLALEIPRGASVILTHRPDGVVRGLEDFAPDIPPVTPVFFAFRVMVGTAFLMIAVAWAGVWATRRQRVPSRRLLWILAGMSISGWVATICGWLVTEIGRQPWLVTGILRTADAVGDVAPQLLGATFAGYVFVYAVLLVAYLVVVGHMAAEGPKSALTQVPGGMP